MDNLRRLWTRCKSRGMAYYRALTRDFNYSTNFFFGLDFLLTASGARLNSKNTTLARCWNIYRCVILAPSIVIPWNSVANVLDGERFEILLSCLHGVLANFSTILRTLLFVRLFGALLDVRRYVNSRRFGKNLQRSRGIRSAAFHHIRKIVIPSVAIVSIVILSFAAVDFSEHHYLKNPFEIPQEFEFFKTVYKMGLFPALVGIGLLSVLVFLTSYMVLTGLMAELKVIVLMFAAIFDETERRVQEKLQLEPGNSRQQTLMKKYYFWKFVQEEFSECSTLHVEFLALLDRIRPFLNATFLTVYYSNVLSLSCGAIYVSQMKGVTLFSVASMYYCLWVAIECAVLSRTVSLLTETNESISREVYNLDWPEKLEWDDRFQEEYRSVRATMLNVMVVAQQPLRLNCFGFFEFTQDRFYELLNMAYSVYRFFRNFV